MASTHSHDAGSQKPRVGSQKPRSWSLDSIQDGSQVIGRETHNDGSETAVGRLLIVDPSPLSLLATAGTFHGAGYTCVCARSHAAASQAISGAVHDAIILDVGSDAAAAAQWLDQVRQFPPHSAVPAVLIADASWAGLELKTERMTVPTRCLFKPIDPHALLAVVDHLLWMPGLGKVPPPHGHNRAQRLDPANERPTKPRQASRKNARSNDSRGWVTL